MFLIFHAWKWRWQRMVLIFRIGPAYNPNRTEVKFPARFLSGFSAEQVTTVLKDKPVVMVNSPREGRKIMVGALRPDMMASQKFS